MSFTNRIAGKVYNLPAPQDWVESVFPEPDDPLVAASIGEVTRIYRYAQATVEAGGEHLYAIYFTSSGEDPSEPEGWGQMLAQHARGSLRRGVYESYMMDRVMQYPTFTPSPDPAAEPGRMTYDYVRRGSLGALGGILVTQAVYTVTGITVVHPLFALLLSAVALAFYAMSKSMEREIEQATKQLRSPSQ